MIAFKTIPSENSMHKIVKVEAVVTTIINIIFFNHEIQELKESNTFNTQFYCKVDQSLQIAN